MPSQPDLDHCLPLDRHKESSSKDIERLVVFLEAEIRKHVGYEGGVATARGNIKVLILNLFHHWQFDPELFTGISRNVNSYEVNSQYNALRITKRIIEIADALKVEDGLGYLDYYPGYRHREIPKLSRNSRIRPTQKLIDLFKERLSSPGSVVITRPTNEEVIYLRRRDPDTGQKTNIPYKDSDAPAISVMRSNLARINGRLEATSIGLQNTPEALEALERAKQDKRIPDLSAKRLHRVFNNESWEQGGRFYGGWWTGAPKYLREYIQIADGNELTPTIELDFACIHIDLLYAMQGIDYHKQIKGDPYTLEGHENDKDLRTFCKIALNVILNADDRNAAIKALREKLQEEKFKTVRSRVDSLGKIGDIITMFEEKHSLIKEHFYKKAGLALQYSDSQIAEKVMIRALDKGFEVLPVHDSFLCGWKHALDMYQLMVAAYQEQVQALQPHNKSNYHPFPRIKFAKSRYAIILRDDIQTLEMMNIETERYEAWMAELAADAGDAEEWDNREDVYADSNLEGELT